METIEKIDAENLEITETTESKRILPKVDILASIANLEKRLVYFNSLLDYFK